MPESGIVGALAAVSQYAVACQVSTLSCVDKA